MEALAVVGKVLKVEPIAGADFINRADVVCGHAGKWSGVVGKDVGEGERVLVFLQDAILPPDDRWSFMEKHHWCVRMARFKGVPSECLIIKGAPAGEIGDDMTEALGVTRKTKPIPASMAGDAEGAFPSFIPKTNETNFQASRAVDRMDVDTWYSTIKFDGSSCTAWVDESTGALRVCSRNWELKEFTASGEGNVYWRVARKYGLERLPPGVALQFEVVGPGIQGNPMGLSDLEGRAFTAFDCWHARRMSLEDLIGIASDVGMPMGVLEISKGRPTDDELRKMAEVKYPNGAHGEGIVIRAIDSAWSFKVLSLRYKG